jgi:hypothetical protein
MKRRGYLILTRLMLKTKIAKMECRETTKK